MLDLYFLGRTLRPNFKFDLSVGFFGAAHVIRMIEFLTNQGLYEKVFFFGTNSKYLISEEFFDLINTKPTEYLKIVKSLPKESDVCLPLT